MNLTRLIVGSLLGVSLAVLAGCWRDASRTASPGQTTRGLERRADRGDVLFSAVVEQLRNLVGQVDTELTPPAVILDSKSSGDGKDVLVTCTTHPDFPDGPINYISVTPENPNSRFRSLGVRPGDILKYYAAYDEEALQAGIQQTVAIDLIVGQVLNDNALLIEGSLTAPVVDPAKIEIWRYVDDRLQEIARLLSNYERYRTPEFDWEPSPDARALRQIVERLNQWMRQSPPKVEWTVDPLLATLDVKLSGDERFGPLVTEEALAASVFAPHDGRLLQEAVWLRDISRWAQGDRLDPVERATALFDWTIRNIQLDDEANAIPRRPWQTLLYGHGTAEQRAWVFAMLCRQQGLDVVMLAVPGAERQADEAGSAPAAPRFWLPALVSDGKLYLFDTRLGLPIPGPDGRGVATLAEVQADPSLLRSLDFEDMPYPVTADDVQHVTAQAVADPFSLSRRAKAVEARLGGDDRLVLTARPSASAAALSDIPGIDKVTIWNYPFQTLRDQQRVSPSRRTRLRMEFEPFAWRPTLWKARVLHFRGRQTPPRENDPTSDVADDHADAIQLYTSRLVRPPDRIIDALGSAPKQRIYSDAKNAAAYWVGLLLFDGGKYASAENWFADPRLAATGDERWTAGTRYNLARTYEAQGKLDEAIALYDADTSPQRHGNRLRGKWLRSRRSENRTDDGDTAP